VTRMRSEPARQAGRTRIRRTPSVTAACRTSALVLAAVLVAGCGRLFPHRSQGEELFRQSCADCHGVDGRGNTVLEMGQPYADLTDDVWKNGGDDGAIANSIREGSFGLMPGFQEKLTDGQIQALVAYLKVLRRRAGASPP
jgi:mono/diheme cytochrome c family protein